MQFNPIQNWFRPKRFGFGWSPATREGWAVTGLAVLLIAGVAARLG